MNNADRMIEITVDEYVKKINEAYERGFKDGVNNIQKNGTSNIPYYPAPYNIEKDIRWETIPEDNNVYEKMPYWMNPKFKMPDITCTKDTSGGTDKW